MSDTGFQPWAGHPERDVTWLAFVLAAAMWLLLWPAVAWFGWWLGVLLWLLFIAAVGVVWGGWSYVLEGWDWLRDRWVR